MKTIELYTENNEFQRAEVLKRNRKKRQQYSQFLVEGVRSINLAVKNNWTFNYLYSSQETKLSDWGQGILKSVNAEVHYRLTKPLIEKLSDKEETSEMLAVVSMPEDNLSRIQLSDNSVVVVFDRPISPGNLGSSIRSCEAFGVDGVVVTGHAVDLYDPHTIRSSMGALFSQTVIRLESHKELMEWVSSQKAEFASLELVGTSASESVIISKHDFKFPTVLIFGNETNGLSSAYRQLCDQVVQIPITGEVSSLNLSCAVSIALYELRRSGSHN